MPDPAQPPLPNPPPPAAAAAWLAQSFDLVALSDSAGRLHWANPAFERATGLGAGDGLLALAPTGGPDAVSARALAEALRTGVATEAPIALRGAGGAALWVRARVARVADASGLLWTLQDLTEQRAVAARAVGTGVDDAEALALARSLDRAAAQLQLAAEIADIVLWRHDLKTDRVHYNDHGFKVLGLPRSPNGLALADVRLYTHPEDRSKLQQSAARALQTNLPVDVETRHRRTDGEWRHLLVRRVVERDAAGEPVAFVGVSLDITDQVAHTRRAEALARRLEAAAGAARIGIWTTTFGTPPQTEWNAQMYELFDMMGAAQPPTLPEWLARCVHPDDADRVQTTIHDYLRSRNGVVEIEFRTRRRDGSVRWMVLRADIDRSHADTLQVFGIAMDVTDRHQALAAMHRASERVALIAAHAGIGIWETEGNNRTARWDDQMFRLRGLEPRPTAPDLDERLALVHPEDRDLVTDANDTFDLGAPSQSSAYEFRVRLPDGQYRWLASRSAVLRDADGTPLQRVGVNWDVTAAKSGELARQQALLAERESQAKSQFLSRMSHELRTPLNAVLGFTQLLQLQARRASAADAIEKLDHIQSAGEHLLGLINDTLDLASLEAGTLKLELQPVALGAAVAQALPMVADLAAAHHVNVRTGRLDGAVRADPGRLRQVLLNLLTNAIQFNRPGGQVIVECGAGAGPDRVRLTVRDTGRGMRPEQLAHLFEPFNRLGVEPDGAAGPGIGLAMVKALVERMGGSVLATSAPGEGTVFEVTLPIPDWAGTPADAGVPAAPLTPRERHGQILYIEDNSVNVLLVEELVKSLSGLRIVSEATGALGVERARSLRPDVILIDMQLPDFDGFEVLRRLRAQPETAATPCIALSANAMPDDIDRAMARGFDDYWTKPIKFGPFLDALERLFPATTT